MKIGLIDRVGSISALLRMLGMYLASSGSLVAANAAQLITFAILARSFGAEEFGLFISVTAITSIAVHVCGLGASECLIRRVARDHTIYPAMLGHNLILSLASGAILVVIGMAVLPFWIRLDASALINALTMLLLLITNIVLVRLITLTEQIFIAHSQFAAANRSVIGFALARTIAAATACLVFGVTRLTDWAVWQFATHMLVMLIYARSLRRLGPPRYCIVRDELKLGVLFATPFIFRAIRQNADLIVLASVANQEIVGSYGVVRRIVDSSYLSIDAMNRLIYPGLARLSATGIHHMMGHIWKLLLAAIAIGVGTALVIYVAAPYLPLLFGQEYTSLVVFCRILSATPILLALWAIAIDGLGAAGLHGPRAAILNTANALGAGVIAWASWVAPPVGTFISIYVIEGSIVIVAWLVLLHLARKSRQAAVIAGHESTHT